MTKDAIQDMYREAMMHEKKPVLRQLGIVQPLGNSKQQRYISQGRDRLDMTSEGGRQACCWCCV